MLLVLMYMYISFINTKNDDKELDLRCLAKKIFFLFDMPRLRGGCTITYLGRQEWPRKFIRSTNVDGKRVIQFIVPHTGESEYYVRRETR